MTDTPSEKTASSTFGRRSRVVTDMTEAEIAQIAASRMSPEHDHLNALLDGASTTLKTLTLIH